MTDQSNDIKDYNHVDLLFPSKYLKGADLKGRDATLVIDSVEPRHELKRSDGAGENKPLMYFRALNGRKIEKGMVLNRTNGDTIAGLYGPEVTGWYGKAITLTTERVKAFGKVYPDALRVVNVKPAARVAGPEKAAPVEGRVVPPDDPGTPTVEGPLEAEAVADGAGEFDYGPAPMGADDDADGLPF